MSKNAASIAKEISVIYGDNNFDTVSLPPPIPAPASDSAPVSHFMSFKSTQNAMEDVLKELKEDKNNKRNNNIVGVYGMGGVGKTSMVKQVAKRVRREGLFHRVVMVTWEAPTRLGGCRTRV